MKAKRIACVLIISFLFLFSGSSAVFCGDLQAAKDAFDTSGKSSLAGSFIFGSQEII
ncbi:MAG TPA: hypothetical protein QF836_08200 [Nitrospinota bacterium]|jgi:hypothetical protein|nr:hypothetical protein [Nitrospinota bacterium]HJN03003.1 hypothetical protein [Nitrospinota bacterium]|tara:strand:- start:330 stop:500 length:171 start_codon:yes stop_codon:yes gene_type:complete